MIELFTHKDGELVTLHNPEKGCWINLTSPTTQEIKQLQSILPVPPDVIETLKDLDEIASMERHPDFLSFIIRTPQDKSETFLYGTLPLGVLIAPDYLVTMCYAKNDVVEAFKRQECECIGIRPLLQLLLLSAKRYLFYLKAINKAILAIQKDLEQSTKNKEFIELLTLEKSLVYFNAALKSNHLLIERLGRNGLVQNEDNKKLIEEVLDENKQAIEMTTIYSSISSGMMDAFASVVSNNLNMVIKLLTQLTVILMIPTLIASIYGMNIELPFQRSPQAFAITMGISILLSLIAVVILRRYTRMTVRRR